MYKNINKEYFFSQCISIFLSTKLSFQNRRETKFLTRDFLGFSFIQNKSFYEHLSISTNSSPPSISFSNPYQILHSFSFYNELSNIFVINSYCWFFFSPRGTKVISSVLALLYAYQGEAPSINLRKVNLFATNF